MCNDEKLKSVTNLVSKFEYSLQDNKQYIYIVRRILFLFAQRDITACGRGSSHADQLVFSPRIVTSSFSSINLSGIRHIQMVNKGTTHADWHIQLIQKRLSFKNLKP